MAYGAVLPHGSEPCDAVVKPGCRDRDYFLDLALCLRRKLSPFGCVTRTDGVPSLTFEDVDMVGQPVEQCAGEAF